MRYNEALIIVLSLSVCAIGGKPVYSFQEQKDKGYIWDGESFVYTNSTEDLINSFFFKDDGDLLSLSFLKFIEKRNSELSSKIVDVQKSYCRCRVNQHINASTITAYIGDTLICIEGKGYSFDSIADDEYVGLHLKKTKSTFQYVSVLGATNTIAKYEVRDISEEKREVLHYCLLQIYLTGVQKDIQAGYIDLSYCSECSSCKGASVIDCPDCLGTGQIEKYKVTSSETIMKEVDIEVSQKMRVAKENYDKKKLRMAQPGARQVARPIPQRSSSGAGDRLALEKEKRELDNRELRTREMVLEKVKNEKVLCPYCDSGKVLCPAHEYTVLSYKEEFAGICDSRKDKQYGQ